MGWKLCRLTARSASGCVGMARAALFSRGLPSPLASAATLSNFSRGGVQRNVTDVHFVLATVNRVLFPPIYHLSQMILKRALPLFALGMVFVAPAVQGGISSLQI